MRLSKDLHRFCPGCGAEADGLQQVEKVFGFQAENNEIVPRPYCKECRSKEQAQFQEQKQLQDTEQLHKGNRAETASETDSLVEIGWARASTWAKRIHTSREVFIKYLIDLGYLTAVSQKACDSDNKEPRKCIEKIAAIGPLQLTEKGRRHSAITNTRFKETLLWDYEAFVDVMKHRAHTANVSYHCPRCGYNLENDPEFDHKEFAYRCHKCGRVYDYFTSKVVFNQ